MKKRLFSLLCLAGLSAGVCVTTTSCSEDTFKVGLICLHDSSSTYDKNFIDSMTAAVEAAGLDESQLEIITGIPEDNTCYTTATELSGTCDNVFADSFGHEDYMLRAARENPNVWFSHTAGVDNYYNAFASIYEGRYLVGIAAGMKLNEMIDAGTITEGEAVIGYVGAYPYAEVISGFTSFYLGARSVCPSATMKVRYTSSWYDYDAEYNAAIALINNDDCVLISQHADSYGAPTACEQNNVPNVSYNISTADQCPNTYLACSRVDWTPYYTQMIEACMNGETVSEKDYCGDLTTGSVVVDYSYSTNLASGTAEAIEAAEVQLNNGTLHVFDTSTFTVNGETLASYLADVDDYGDYVGETEAVSDGYFHESEYRSAPYFDIIIDGITAINE